MNKKTLMEFGLRALREQTPPIPKIRPTAPYTPASSTGGIEPAPINTGTKGTVMAQQTAIRTDSEGNPVSPLEAMGLKLPTQRPTGSEVPKYRNMPDIKSGVGGVVQRILGR